MVSGHGTGASAREIAEIGDIVIDCTYEIQNDTLRSLDIFSLPLILDPREAYSGIENCRFQLAAEQ
jgi:hypothetical protein